MNKRIIISAATIVALAGMIGGSIALAAGNAPTTGSQSPVTKLVRHVTKKQPPKKLGIKPNMAKIKVFSKTTKPATVTKTGTVYPKKTP